MNIDDVHTIFHQFDAYIKTITEISCDSDGEVALCNYAGKAYSYDEIINHVFCGNDVCCSVDAISFKEKYINFIEFKNTAITKRIRKEIRLKVAEGMHYIERVLLKSNFLAAHAIKTRFILVYSKEKNQVESPKQKTLNDAILSVSSLTLHRRFIHESYDKKWHYVDEALSMNEVEFLKDCSKYI